MKSTVKILSVLFAVVFLFAACANAGQETSQPESSVVESSEPAESEPESEPTSEAPAEGEESGLDLPIGNGLVITDLCGYSGQFIEDGTDELVSNIAAIMLRNDGEQTVQYAHIKTVINGADYEFDISTLPVGAEMLALDINREALPNEIESLTAELTSYAPFETEPSMCEDSIAIETQDTAITITNISDTDIAGDIYIYYKSAYNDLYMGGITYRVSASGLAAGESKTCYAGHFYSDYSKLMFVSYVQ